MTMSFFPALDHSTMSGLRVFWTTSGKSSLFSMSTSMFQPVVPPRIDDHTLRFCNVGCAVCVFLVSPDLTKAICLCWGLLPCSFFCSFSSQLANSLRTESCLHWYLPCVSAIGQDDRTCSRVPGLSHRLH